MVQMQIDAISNMSMAPAAPVGALNQTTSGPRPQEPDAPSAWGLATPPPVTPIGAPDIAPVEPAEQALNSRMATGFDPTSGAPAGDVYRAASMSAADASAASPTQSAGVPSVPPPTPDLVAGVYAQYAR